MTIYAIHGQATDHETAITHTGPGCETVTLDADKARTAQDNGRSVEIHTLGIYQS